MDTIFIATADTVVAINKNTGAAVWKTELPGSSLGGCGVTSIALDTGLIYAHAKGELFCLSQKTGKILWRNGLAGLGFSTCIIAVPGQSTSLQMHAAAEAVTTTGAGDAGHTAG